MIPYLWAIEDSAAFARLVLQGKLQLGPPHLKHDLGHVLSSAPFESSISKFALSLGDRGFEPLTPSV